MIKLFLAILVVLTLSNVAFSIAVRKYAVMAKNWEQPVRDPRIDSSMGSFYYKTANIALAVSFFSLIPGIILVVYLHVKPKFTWAIIVISWLYILSVLLFFTVLGSNEATYYFD